MNRVFRQVRLGFIAVLVIVWTCLPIYHMVMLSLTPQTAAFAGRLWPDNPSLENYRSALTRGPSFPGPLLGTASQQRSGRLDNLRPRAFHRQHHFFCPRAAETPLGPGDQQHGPFHLPHSLRLRGHSPLPGHGAIRDPEPSLVLDPGPRGLCDPLRHLGHAPVRRKRALSSSTKARGWTAPPCPRSSGTSISP